MTQTTHVKILPLFTTLLFQIFCSGTSCLESCFALLFILTHTHTKAIILPLNLWMYSEKFKVLNVFGEHQDVNDSYIASDIKQNQCGRLIKGLLNTLRHILTPLILFCQPHQMSATLFNPEFLTFRCKRQGGKQAQNKGTILNRSLSLSEEKKQISSEMLLWSPGRL